MRTVHTHPEKCIGFSPRASALCQILNQIKREDPKRTFKQMREIFNKKYSKNFGGYKISESCTRRYYYGMHFGPFYTSYSEDRSGRVCKGASVLIPINIFI